MQTRQHVIAKQNPKTFDIRAQPALVTDWCYIFSSHCTLRSLSAVISIDIFSHFHFALSISQFHTLHFIYPQSHLHVPRIKTDCSVDVVLLLCCSTAPQISNHIPTAIRVSLSLRLLHNIASKHSFASPQHSHQLATPTHL